MDAPEVPRKPESSQQKGISAVSVMTIGREGDHEERQRERDIGGRNKLQPLRTNFNNAKKGVELLPKPSSDSRDPLVSLLCLKVR